MKPTPREMLIESITKASQCADMLAEDVRGAHRMANLTEPLVEMMLRAQIVSADKLRACLAELSAAIKP